MYSQKMPYNAFFEKAIYFLTRRSRKPYHDDDGDKPYRCLNKFANFKQHYDFL